MAGEEKGSTPNPRYRQIADAIIQLIERGDIPPDTKLPPIRKLAEAMGINSITAVNAYKYLENRRYAYSITGSGTYAANSVSLHDGFAPFDIFDAYEDKGDGWINFANSSTSADLFPVEEFKGLFNWVLERDRGDAFGYGDKQGYMPLRTALQGYLQGFGIKALSEKNIQIISGAQQGVDIISAALLSPGDGVVVENPTYYGAVGSFISRGAEAAGIGIEKDGPDIAKLERLIRSFQPKLYYAMPVYQTPTCYSYSLSKKREVLELANKYGFYIVEEDNQSDFTYFSEIPTPIKALDYKNKVIYIKSFSKILMPGLRLGFMVMPDSLLKRVSPFKAMGDTSGFIQRAFELFITTGAMERHVKAMREEYSSRYRAMEAGTEKHIKGRLGYENPGGGLNFWFALPNALHTEEFCQNLLAREVIVTPGSLFSLHGEEAPHIRLSFANVRTEEIGEGLNRIGLELDKILP